MNLRAKSLKHSLRSYFKHKRQDIDSTEWNRANYAIFEHLFDWEVFIQAHTVHSYVSMTKHREVDTLKIISDCLEQRKKIVVPIIAGNRQLRHSYIDDITNVQKNYWGVFEPKRQVKADITDLDLVLVPLLAIDRQGTRLGYGAGYYDGFLAKLLPSTIKMGLLLDGFNVCTLPREPWDIPLDGYISESGIHLL